MGQREREREKKICERERRNNLRERRMSEENERER